MPDDLKSKLLTDTVQGIRILTEYLLDAIELNDLELENYYRDAIIIKCFTLANEINRLELPTKGELPN